MASEVQICNLALSHLGESNLIASIAPPDGSVNAGLCATYYGVARAELLETGNWQFSQKRSVLAQTANESEAFAFAYTPPSNVLRVLKVLGPEDREDGEGQNYEMRDGVLYTNVELAVCIYVRNITDATRFSPTFVATLAYLLAGYLAGPVIKGADGMRIGDMMRERAAALADRSLALSANSRKTPDSYVPSGIRARR